MRRTAWVVALLIAVVSAAAVALSDFGSSASSEAPAQLPPPEDPGEPIRIAAAGRVEPAGEEFYIASEISGRLARVPVAEGDTVRAGQVVAELVADDYRARVAAAEAEVAQRQAVLERLRNGARDEELRGAQAQLRGAETELEASRTEVERRRALVEPGAVSRAEFARFVREQDVAETRVDAARQHLALLEDSARPEDIERAGAELTAAEARLREARALLAKTEIRSPIDGVVLHRWRKMGESVMAGAANPILSVGDVSRLVVRVDVDETDVARIRLGQRSYVTAQAYPDQRFTGRVVRIGQALGRKNIRTDEPTERVDKKILETLVELDHGQTLPIGLRVDAFLE